MKSDRIQTERAPHSQLEPREAAPEREVKRQGKAVRLRIRTGLRAGDIYMQYPRGSNNRLP
jgi:hypothetical protein